MIPHYPEYALLGDELDAIDEKDTMNGLYTVPQSSGLWYSKIGTSPVVLTLLAVSLISNILLLVRYLHLSSKNSAVVERTVYGIWIA